MKDLAKLPIKLTMLGPLACALCTLVISPNLTMDPINVPKFIILSVGTSLMAIFILKTLLQQDYARFSAILFGDRVFFALTWFLWLIMGLSLAANNLGIFQALVGTWGRNSGFLTWTSLLILTIAGYLISINNEVIKTLRIFHVTSMVVLAYSIVQILGVDPVPWNSNLVTSSLGNLNFVSAIFGFSSIIMLIRVLNVSNSWDSRLYAVAIIIFYMIFFFWTQSLQGFVMFVAAGASLFLIEYLSRSGISVTKKVALLIQLSLIALFLLMGVFGLGPLAKHLEQETMIFRIDYWSAGVRGLGSNLLTGLGFDNFGNFYRFFRDDSAVARTGPQRVTDTAHNIFLDFGLSVGFLGIIGLILLFSLAVYRSGRNLVGICKEKKNRERESGRLLFGLTVACVVFMLISINQIGVSVWIFLFIGMALGRRFRFQTESKETIKLSTFDSFVKNYLTFIKNKKIRGLTITVAYFLIFANAAINTSVSAKLFLQEFQFARYFKLPNSTSIYGFVESDQTLSSGLQEIAIDRLVKEGKLLEAQSLALELAKRNPNNFFAWVMILENPLSSQDERRIALSELGRIDPQNPNWKLESLRTQGES